MSVRLSLDRYKTLWRFVKFLGKAEEIEKEWQRIQQDEHDFEFAFNVSPSEDSKVRYIHKKGLADGIKWCIRRFC